MRNTIMLVWVGQFAMVLIGSYRAKPRYSSVMTEFAMSRLRSTRTGSGGHALLPVLGILMLSGCATTAEPKSDGINVALGQTANVGGPRIKPVALLEDSRCPINARCIWVGRVRLKVLWIKPSGDEDVELVLGEPKPMADGAITLTAVTPEKVTTRENKPGDYRFTFAFSGGL
jgi:hypothetical protein